MVAKIPIFISQKQSHDQKFEEKKQNNTETTQKQKNKKQKKKHFSKRSF